MGEHRKPAESGSRVRAADAWTRHAGARLLGAGWRRGLTIAAGIVLVLALGTAVTLGTNPALLRSLGLSGSAVPAPEPVPPRLQITRLAADAPTPGTTGLAGALDPLASVPQLGTATGVVVDPATGRTLWSRSPGKALVPGSTHKLLTTAAALLALDSAATLSTRVVAGPTADSVVLVGGGDPTLSSLPAGQESVYPGAARLDDLAAAVRAAHPGPIRTVTVDLTRYTGPGLAKGWLPEDVPGGYVTPIEPLIMDGGRSKPDEADPPRTSTPGLDAGRALAARLGADQAAVRSQPASGGAAVLGEVRSPPIAALVETALRISDNVLAETLAREVAVARGGETSFTGASREVLATLREAGLDVTGATVQDGSGLSTGNQVPARLLGEIMAAAARPTGTGPGSGSDPGSGNGSAAGAGTPPDGPAPVSGSAPVAGPAERAGRLRPLLAGLPVAGGDGTLDDRFASGPSAPGRGWVRAKTGTLTGVSSLAGVVLDADGRLLVFALMSNGTSPADSRPRLDAVAAALRGCGCR